MTVMRHLARFRVTALGIILLPLLALLPWVSTGTAAAQSTPIQHIVVLYLENHTFDSLLGYWCDRHPARGCIGMPASVRLSNGTVVQPTDSPDMVPWVQHTVSAQQKAINGGKMNGWGQIVGCGVSAQHRCVSGYKPAQVPNLTSLAAKFAISDHTFSMQDSPSYGGHLYAAMATNDGFTGDIPVPAPGVAPGPGWGCDSDLITPWHRTLTGPLQWMPSCVPDWHLGLAHGGAFESTHVRSAPTIMDRLDAAGLTWRIYGEPTPGGAKSTGYGWDICPSIAECLYTSQRTNNVLAAQFTTDAAAGACRASPS